MKFFLHNKLELKDFTESKGIVAFYYSSFNNIDLVGDVVQPTAFLKTVSENKSHIYHNRDHRESVGNPLEFGQDTKGAFVVSQLGLKTACGLDCFEQYKAEMIKGHSMEYETVKSSYDEVNDVRTIIEAKLWGVTSVTNIPANLNATTISLKSFEDIQESMRKISSFLKDGNISDDCGKLFLKEYDRLKIIAISLEEKYAAAKSTAENNSEPKSLDYAYITNNLKLS